MPYGLRIVQLKRALRGLAFARGSLLTLRAEGRREVGGFPLDQLARELDALAADAVERLRELRQRLTGSE